MPIGVITPGSYVTITPDADPAPYGSIQAVSAGMPVASADIQTLALELLNAVNASVIFPAMPAITYATEGMRVFVEETLYYEYTASTPFTADGLWVVTATGMGVGQWINGALAAINLGMFVPLGTVPGGWANGSTNKLDEKFVPYGHRNHGSIPPGTDSTTDATAPSTTGGHQGILVLCGDLVLGDLLHVELPAVAGNAVGDFQASWYISYDGGTTWFATVTPQPSGGAPLYKSQGSANYRQALASSFALTIPTSGNVRLSFRYSSTSGTTNLEWGAGRFWVNRP